jgi:hypothetical protein
LCYQEMLEQSLEIHTKTSVQKFVPRQEIISLGWSIFYGGLIVAHEGTLMLIRLNDMSTHTLVGASDRSSPMMGGLLHRSTVARVEGFAQMGQTVMFIDSAFCALRYFSHTAGLIQTLQKTLKEYAGAFGMNREQINEAKRTTTLQRKAPPNLIEVKVAIDNVISYMEDQQKAVAKMVGKFKCKDTTDNFFSTQVREIMAVQHKSIERLVKEMNGFQNVRSGTIIPQLTGMYANIATTMEVEHHFAELGRQEDTLTMERMCAKFRSIVLEKVKQMLPPEVLGWIHPARHNDHLWYPKLQNVQLPIPIAKRLFNLILERRKEAHKQSMKPLIPRKNVIPTKALKIQTLRRVAKLYSKSKQLKLRADNKSKPGTRPYKLIARPPIIMDQRLTPPNNQKKQKTRPVKNKK